MGVRVEVGDGESIRNAMLRLKKLSRYQLGWKYLISRRRADYFNPLSEVRRKKTWDKLQMAKQETRSGKRQEHS